MRSRWVLPVAMLLFSVAAQSIHAQDVASKEAYQRERCRLAAQVITTGRPATKADWAWRTIAGCHSDGAAAVASAIAQLGVSDDSALRERVLSSAVFLKDGRIFGALVAVATSAGAPSESRITAIKGILAQYNDAVVVGDERRFRMSGPNGYCGFAQGTSARSDTGQALPSDMRLQAVRAMQRTAQTTADPAVASAAWCVRGILEAGDDLLFQPSLLTVQAKCGDRFVAHSAHDRAVHLAWVTADGSRSGEIVIAPGTTKEFSAVASEPITFSVAGTTIAQISSQSPCP